MQEVQEVQFRVCCGRGRSLWMYAQGQIPAPARGYRLFWFSKRQTPDHGRSRRDFSVSGRSATRRRKKGNRLSCAAFFKSDCTSTGFHPYRSKNRGPSSGANLKGAAWVSWEAIRFLNMRSSPGEAISTIHEAKLGCAARSVASSLTASAAR